MTREPAASPKGTAWGSIIDNGTEVAYRELTLTGGEWQPQLRRSDFGAGKLTLAACSPVQGAGAGKSPVAEFTLAADQSAEGLAAADLLFAQRSLPAGSNRAELSFTHAMHRLRIELSGDEQVLSVELRSRMKGSLELLTGGLTPADEFGWITPRRNADGSYEAVIFPQSVEAFRSDEGLLRITTSEREIIYKAPEQLDGAPLERFEAGKQLTLCKPSGGDSELANRSLWVYGLSVPDFPGEGNLPTYSVAFDVGAYRPASGSVGTSPTWRLKTSPGAKGAAGSTATSRTITPSRTAASAGPPRPRTCRCGG